jgi:uncharacterized protein
MSPPEAAAIAAAGLGAGVVNTIVGSGSLITFPTLMALGYPPVVANVSNTVGLVPGAVSGAYGYRRELVGQRERARWLGALAIAGGFTGAILLLVLPASAFGRIVPILILVACALVAFQPRLSRMLAARRVASGGNSRALGLLVYLCSIYGGYFGAAQSVILIALLAIFLPDTLQRLNGLKIVLALLVNGVAAILFIAVAPVAWQPALLIGAGSVVGGRVGASIGRRLPPMLFRSAIVGVGVLVAVKLLAT